MKISILMCTYNSDKTLQKAIDSVLVQNYSNWELLILDNGSSDKTVDVLKKYEKQDSRIRCDYRADNVGWCYGIKLMLEKAKGKYMMFMGADDLLSTSNSLNEVMYEAKKNSPDIIWTGYYYADLIQDGYELLETCIPKYHIYTDTEKKIDQIVDIMKNVYYNSVMHYVNIDFLRKNNIDFFSPFYSDCQGMTEALCRARKMVVLDKAEYILVRNTSKMSQRVCFEHDVTKQWKSVYSYLFEEMNDSNNKVKVEYIAQRILNNMISILKGITTSNYLTDLYMTKIEVTYEERFLKIQKWLSNPDFGEMMRCSGKGELYENELFCAVAMMFFEHKLNENKNLIHDSWLAKLCNVLFLYSDKENMLQLKKCSREDMLYLLRIIHCQDNTNHIGQGILMKM